MLLTLVWVAAGDGPDPRLAEFPHEDYAQLYSLATPVDLPHLAFEGYRKIIEKQKKEDLDGLAAERRQLKFEDDMAHTGLDALNREASRDTKEMAQKRSDLHCRIYKLEDDLEERKTERSIALPATYDHKLAKLGLAESWPAKKKQIDAAIAGGWARVRKHGDIDDIGFRRLGQGQDHDIKLGEGAVRELRAYRLLPPEVQNRALQQYIQELANTLAASSDLKVPVQATLLDSTEVNAFGLPGGLLFVNAGLIAKCDTEAELAGVLSHELAHIAARHGERLCRITSSVHKMVYQGAQMAADAFTGGAVGQATHYAKQYLGLGVSLNLALLGVSRDTEAEAAQLGLQYTWHAGYDPAGLLSFYDKMTDDTNIVEAASFFRTHPPSVETGLAVFSELEYLRPRANPKVDSAAFVRAKELVRAWEQRKAEENKKAGLGAPAGCESAGQ